MLLGFLDEDTISLYDEILHLLGRKKKELTKRKSVNIQPRVEDIEQKVFNSYIGCSDSFSMEEGKGTDNQY